MRKIALRAGLALVLAAAASLANAQEFTMKLSSPTARDANQRWLETFGNKVEKGSNGRIKAEVYPGSQLGQIPATIEGVALGTIEVTAPAAGFFVGLDPRFEIFDVPGLFNDLDHAQRALSDPELLDRIAKYGSDKGIRPIAVYPFAAMGLISNKPVKNPGDLEGQKIRVAGPAALQSGPFRKYGASPVSMPLGETLPALQTGGIDGLLAGVPVFTNFKFYDVAKDLTVLPQTYLIVAIVASQAFLDQIGPELSELVYAAARETTLEINETNDAEVARKFDEWKENGGILYEFSKADADAYIATVESFIPQAIEDNPALEAELEAFRSAAARHENQ